jgi:ElaB/YqjD/DUF883 family membrane-anchored ribosome-binding protein
MGGSTSGSSGLSVDAAKETARGLIDQAKSTAGQAYGVATEKATTKLEEKKGDLATGLTSVADTIRQVGSTLRESDEHSGISDTAAQYSDTFARQIEQISNYFERNDVRAMVRDAERFARRNPAVFIGGAFALGILAARFLKSSGSRSGGGNYSRNRSSQNYINPMNEDDQVRFKGSGGSTGSGTGSLGSTGTRGTTGTSGMTGGTSSTDLSSTSSDFGTGSTGQSSTGDKSATGGNKTINPS